jgi:hypothetical protein
VAVLRAGGGYRPACRPQINLAGRHVGNFQLTCASQDEKPDEGAQPATPGARRCLGLVSNQTLGRLIATRWNDSNYAPNPIR